MKRFDVITAPERSQEFFNESFRNPKMCGDWRQRCHATFVRCASLLLATAAICLSWSVDVSGQDLEAPPNEANVIASAAVNMQNDGKHEIALLNWEQLIRDYPNTSATVNWRYNAGLCLHQLNRHADAVAMFEAVVKSSQSGIDFVDESLLYLGFNQLRLAQQIKANHDSDPDQLERAQKLVEQAAESLIKLNKDFPQFEYRDQALFFQGDALSEAGRMTDAATSFGLVVEEFPDSDFWSDAVYRLARLHEDSADFEAVIAQCDRLLKADPDDPQATEARFLKAEALLQLADAAKQNGNGDTARGLFQQAADLYEQVASDPDFADAMIARYQRGICLSHFAESGVIHQWFTDFHRQHEKSPLTAAAAAIAGRQLFLASDHERAESVLQSVRSANPADVQIAHWLCQTMLKTDRAMEARNVVQETLSEIEDVDDSSAILLMDMGDTYFAAGDDPEKSAEFYLQLCDSFPQHPLADQALYNACFSLVLAKQPGKAREAAIRFYTAFPQSELTPDVREVEAESFILDQQYPSAVAVLEKLVDDFPRHNKLKAWSVRLGQVQAMLGDADEAMARLAPLIDQLQGAEQAEALFHLAEAQFQSKKYAEAAATLERSLEVDDTWRRVDEVLLLAARAAFQAGDIEKARSLAARCAEEFPQSVVRDQLVYRMAEIEFESGEYDKAEEYYTSLLTDTPDSPLVPAALYGRGWSHLRRGKHAEAIESLDRLLRDYPEHPFADDALLARAIARRQNDQPADAITDFNKYLEVAAEGNEKISALYERGLAEIKLAEWPSVVRTFTQLVEIDANGDNVDRYLYELAWAHRQMGENSQALAHFQRIVTDFPESPLAAEAYFHQGENAYADEDFEAAVKLYAAGAKLAKDPVLAEKIAYKLAFSHYRLDEFESAESIFRQQVSDHDDGALAADGMFMIGESLFRQKKHADAVKAYKIALPAVDASSTVSQQVKQLTRLHGAQSANEAGDYQTAIDMVKPIVESGETTFAEEAWLEYANGLKGTGQVDAAIDAWRKAATALNKTGIRARAMIGEAYFEKKQFDEAIKEFALAVYGYGGKSAEGSIRPWQAFAAYEAGRCYTAQFTSAPEDQRAKLVTEAKYWFEYITENYADDRLASDAKKQLDKLNNL